MGYLQLVSVTIKHFGKGDSNGPVQDTGEFKISKEDWKSYRESLEQYITANDINNVSKKRAVLINSCGAVTHRLWKVVIKHQAPSAVTFEEIVRKMTAHFQPHPQRLWESIYNTRVHHSHECVATYFAQLKQLAQYCKIGDTLQQMLRGRLICVIGEEHWQKCLLSEEALTYEQAVKVLLALENHEVKDMPGQKQLVNQIHPNPRLMSHIRTKKQCKHCWLLLEMVLAF